MLFLQLLLFCDNLIDHINSTIVKQILQLVNYLCLIFCIVVVSYSNAKLENYQIYSSQEIKAEDKIGNNNDELSKLLTNEESEYKL